MCLKLLKTGEHLTLGVSLTDLLQTTNAVFDPWELVKALTTPESGWQLSSHGSSVAQRLAHVLNFALCGHLVCREIVTINFWVATQWSVTHPPVTRNTQSLLLHTRRLLCRNWEKGPTSRHRHKDTAFTGLSWRKHPRVMTTSVILALAAELINLHWLTSEEEKPHECSREWLPQWGRRRWTTVVSHSRTWRLQSSNKRCVRWYELHKGDKSSHSSVECKVQLCPQSEPRQEETQGNVNIWRRRAEQRANIHNGP